MHPRAIFLPEGLCNIKNSNDNIWNRTRDIPACSALHSVHYIALIVRMAVDYRLDGMGVDLTCLGFCKL
jgi:hypothetical protein